jgi:hypothetical protein
LDATDRIAVNAVEQIILREFGWIFREQAVSDYGIDAHVEIADAQPTGRLIALQIKGGKSFFAEKNDESIVFRGEARHLDYWQNHSLPVVLVLYEPDEDAAYWQVISSDTIERTGKGWKVNVPLSQKLDASAKDTLENLADVPLHIRRLNELTLAKSWMNILAEGGELFLEAEEWINKSIGRGSLSLKGRDKNGTETLVKDWPFVAFPHWPYAALFPHLFPWADFEVDPETYDPFEQDAYESACGVWDKEDGRYAFFTETFEEWRSNLVRIRPYKIAAGEVAFFRLQLTINELGRAFLKLDKYLMDGERPELTGMEGRFANEYGAGLKMAAIRYGLVDL